MEIPIDSSIRFPGVNIEQRPICSPRQKLQATVTLVEGFRLFEVVAPVPVLVLPPSSADVPGSFFTTGDLCTFLCSGTASCVSIAGGRAIELA